VDREVSFDYERFLTPVGFVWVPIASVEVFHGNHGIELDFVVDSGADLTMVPLRIGHLLQLKRGTRRDGKLSGIAGGVSYTLHRVTLGIGPFRISSRLAWADDDDVPLLLGRVEALDRFVITLDGRRRRVTFRQA